MREDLLGYLLGALDVAEHEALTKKLDRDPSLRRELQLIESRLAFLNCERWRHDPPLGLADRACAIVTEHESGVAIRGDSCCRGASLRPVSYSDVLGTRAGWSLADFIVAAGVFLAASMLFFPAISNSRNQAQLAMCRDNLRQLGVSLSQFSDLNGGYFPKVATSGNLAAAGVYAPQLMEAGLLTDSKQLLCPSSPLTSQRGPQFRVPTIDELKKARGRLLIVLQRQMGGSYGYNLGYVANGQYHATRNRGRAYFAIVSDAPSFDAARMGSKNHANRGQNVLFENGRVKYLQFDVSDDVLGDDVFHSDRGLIEAGRSPDDAVIGSSATPPLLLWSARD